MSSIIVNLSDWYTQKSTNSFSTLNLIKFGYNVNSIKNKKTGLKDLAGTMPCPGYLIVQSEF